MATPQPLTFAHLLRRARLGAGLTQEALAERAGLAVRSISDLERGLRRAPYKATIALLADALHLGEAERAAFAAAASGHAIPAPHPVPSSAAVQHHDTSAPPPFVGRQHEIERLERHLAGAGGPVLLLAGEPGIGKSRLLRETMIHARATGWAVVDGGCTRRSGQEIFAPLVGALARYLARLPAARVRADLQGCAWLVRLLPELVERAVVPLPEWAMAPNQERRLMFAAVGRFLTNVAGPAGTLLVLDDLQWAGPDALDLLESLVRGEMERPLRVLGAYRSTEVWMRDPLGLLLTDLARDGLAAEMAIGPLAAAAAADLVKRLLPPEVDDAGERGVRVEASQRLVARAGGMPFFLVSGARALARDATTEVPWDVRQSIHQRVSALPEATQELLGAAAVAGRVVPGPLLLALAGRAERDTLAALKAARQARLVVETGRAEYAFVHDLVREVVEAELSQGQRAAWHRRIAEWLEELPARDRDRHNAEIAQHFVASDQPERALPFALAAGDQAEAAYAHTEAEEYYRLALALAREKGDQTREAMAWEGLHFALSNQARFDTAQEAADQAAALYQAIGDGERMVQMLARFGEMHVARGRPLGGLARLEPFRSHVETSAPSPGMARYLATLSHLYHQTNRHEEALAIAERAIAIARSIEYAAGLAHGQHVLINALRGLGRTAELEEALEHIVPLCEAAGDLLRLGVGLGNVAMQRASKGDLSGARAPLERALQVAEQLGEANLVAQILNRRGQLSYWLGEWGRAAADYERALSLYHEIGPAVSAVEAPLACASLLIAQGHRETAHGYIEESLANANDHFRARLSRFARSLEAEDLLLQGHTDGARDLLEPLYDPAESWSDAAMLAWAYADLGQSERAAAVLKPYLERAAAQHDEIATMEGQCIQAILALRQRHWQKVGDLLGDVIARCRAMPYPYAEAKARYVYGQVAAAHGETAPARERFAAALAILNRLGERLYAEQVERAVAELAVREPV